MDGNFGKARVDVANRACSKLFLKFMVEKQTDFRFYMVKKQGTLTLFMVEKQT